MSLRVILIVVSVFTMYFMIKRIRHSKIRIEDSIFWIIFSAFLIIVSAFPGFADYLSKILGIYSTANFIFMGFIFILIVKSFLMTIKISQLDNKIIELTQKIAIGENLDQEKKNKEKD